jgi:adenosylcobinamide-GDP ribazoletransferase
MRDNELAGDATGGTSTGAEPADNRIAGTASAGHTNAPHPESPLGGSTGGPSDPGSGTPPPAGPSSRDAAIGALTGWWRDFAHAATFLTRIPFHVEDDVGGRPLAAAARAFPIVGLVVGVVGAVALMTASALGLPNLAAGLIAIAATALVTGGLHEDGLADTIDGVLGGHDREDTLAIMRDSRIGAFGTLALIFVIALKVSALEALDTGSAAAALIGAEVAGRAVLPAILFQSPPARGNGLSFQAGTPTRESMILALLLGAVLVLLMLGIVPGLVAILVAAALTALITRAADVRLGGHTGDVLGAAEQIVATAVLLVAAAVV